ncbi:MAG: hypothetical protein K6V36_10005 [Anaerolineae bacterium]|nr:hypothetical protein [Anaerolineae bacterium]
MTGRSGGELHNVRPEADGSISLELTPVTSAVPGALREAPIRYQVANPTLSATVEFPGRLSRYDVFHVGAILEPGAWRQTLRLDGRPPDPAAGRVRVRARAMTEEWHAPGCTLRVSSFCDAGRNAIYQAYELTSLDDQPHELEALISAAFVSDEELSAYGLHYDERYDAIVAIFGETASAGPRRPAEGPARAALLGADLSPAEWEVSGPRAYLTYRLHAGGGQSVGFCLVVTGGWQRQEHEALFQQAIGRWRQELDGAQRYGDWLAGRLEVHDRVLHSAFVAALNAAASAYRVDREGRFRGLLPAPEEGSAPAVVIPCDVYWCSQALLPFWPERVREAIFSLARAVHEDGRLGRSIRTLPEYEEGPGGSDPSAYEVWPDACDSPSYFAMLVHDYVCWTGEQDLLEERVGGRSIWEKALACVSYLRSRDTNHDLLFEKRRTQPDWAFDVLRDDWVTYDLCLHCQALKNVSEMALLRGDEATARDMVTWMNGAQTAINRRLWHEGRGHYVDYVRSYQGFVEDHAAIDTVVAALYGIGTESQCHRHLEHLERMLETRQNEQQYYGDWGLMSCYPFYKERGDLEGRSAWAYSFHNGAAWPGWSGVFALAELLHRRPGWRYALERWWTYALERRWLTPPEYYAPPYDAPELRQSLPLYAWSGMPAAAMILGGFGVWPNIAGEVVLRVPPWGDSRLNGVRLRGEVYDIVAKDGVVSVWHEGDVVASGEHGLRIRLGRAVQQRAGA